MGTGLGGGAVLLRTLPPQWSARPGGAGRDVLMPSSSTPGVVFWFRNDLRLHDQPALHEALNACTALNARHPRAGWLLPVFVHDAAQSATTAWGFERMGAHRRAWLASALRDLSDQLETAGSRLLQSEGDTVAVLATLLRALGNPLLVCEEIPAPEEQRMVQALRDRGACVRTVWQSTLLDPANLPFDADDVPDTFSVFRQRIEQAQLGATLPLAAPHTLPHLPAADCLAAWMETHPAPDKSALNASALPDDPRAAFPCRLPQYNGGEHAALAHLQRYCARGLPHTYKSTRNGLIGADYSSKWSPWLATGALSARAAWDAVRRFAHEHGANDGTYWLWFELLWRDHFRFLHRKHGTRLYHARGLCRHDAHDARDAPSRRRPSPTHDAAAFARWCRGETGHPFIDAGMRELAATGYLSNRMRQNVASTLIHDLGCDWRAGAAWFEARLLDFDVCSNQGNWLYLSGRGTDPRGSRRFNPDKQARDYDPEGAYRALWARES